MDEVLACPHCRGALIRRPTTLTCRDCGMQYGMRDGVPELLPPGSASTGPAGVLGRLAANPRVYDLVQLAAGARRIQARLRQVLADANGLVLDAGAGTGSLEPLLPAGTRYLWLDPDPAKLSGFRAKSRSPAVLGDATRLPLGDQSVDWSVSIAVSHHLDDDGFGRMLGELRRVTRGRVLFLDAIDAARVASRCMWRIDRRTHPRSAETLARELEARFRLEYVEDFSVFHRYLLAVGRPELQARSEERPGLRQRPSLHWAEAGEAVSDQ